MSELKPCPFCGMPPKIGYACGEYFVYGEDDDCPICGLDFGEMHSSEELEIEAWNRRVGAMNELKPCPFCGGEAVVRAEMGHLYIRPIHKKDCFLKPDTWLRSSLPLKKQIVGWNRRVDNE